MQVYVIKYRQHQTEMIQDQKNKVLKFKHQNLKSSQCLYRWNKVLNPEVVKGPWSKEEDNYLIGLLKADQANNVKTKWSVIAKTLPGLWKTCKSRY